MHGAKQSVTHSNIICFIILKKKYNHIIPFSFPIIILISIFEVLSIPNNTINF